MPIELVMAMEREVSTKHFVKKIVKFSLVELDKKSKELRSISIDLSRYLLTPSSHNKVPFNNGKGILYFDIIYENIEMTNSDMKTQKTTVKLHKKRSSSNSNNDCLSKSVGNTPTQPKRVESDTSELDKIDSSKKSSPNSPIDSVVDLRVSQLLKFPMKSSSPQPECPLTSEDIKNGHYRRKSSGSSNRRSIQSPRKYSQDTTLLSPTHEEVVAFSKLKEEAVELEAKVTESKKQLNAINTELQLKTSNNYNASFDVINFFIDSVLVMDYVMKEEFTHTAHLIIEKLSQPSLLQQTQLPALLTKGLLSMTMLSKSNVNSLSYLISTVASVISCINSQYISFNENNDVLVSMKKDFEMVLTQQISLILTLAIGDTCDYMSYFTNAESKLECFQQLKNIVNTMKEYKVKPVVLNTFLEEYVMIVGKTIVNELLQTDIELNSSVTNSINTKIELFNIWTQTSFGEVFGKTFIYLSEVTNIIENYKTVIPMFEQNSDNYLLNKCQIVEILSKVKPNVSDSVLRKLKKGVGDNECKLFMIEERKDYSTMLNNL
ncbi:hypothetical protein QTN25_008393 [Entamoeba marina]